MARAGLRCRLRDGPAAASAAASAVPAVDAVRRIQKVAAAGDDEKKLRAARRYAVRGLRRCSNNACLAHLNRDHNPAINIQRRCVAILSGDDPSRDAVEEQLDGLELRLRCGD